MAPTLNLIDSSTSTVVSSKPFVEMVSVPEEAPFAILISLAETLYSEVSLAVPETTKVNVISLPDRVGATYVFTPGVGLTEVLVFEVVPASTTADKVAVKTISAAEFSIIFGLLNDNLTTGASSSSVMVRVDEIVAPAVAFTTFLPVMVIVSSSSSMTSSIVVIVALPDNSPALTTICGFNKKRKTRWLFRSTTYKLPLPSNDIPVRLLIPLATTSPVVAPGAHFVTRPFPPSPTYTLPLSST